METVRGPMRFCLTIALFAPYLFISGCKPCHNCEELPGEVTHMLGEWEWFMTIRSTDVGNNYDFDYITPSSTNKNVRLTLDSEGCMKFYIGESENHVCVDYYEHRFYSQPGQLSNYQCAESNRVILIGDDIDIAAKILVYGPTCSELDTLKGARVPFNQHTAFITPPPLPAGHELQGYTNFFTRIR